ncbi:anti-sigma B factor antagonist [Lachnospiraceae bacterium]|nr:anti-sigma B factor antagonist [Lachnospiraceae bacterium]
MLNINSDKSSMKLVISLEGRLDTTSSPQLEEFIKKEVGNTKELVYDLKNLEYISSAGLRVLLSSQKIMNKQGAMVLKNVSEEVMEVFEVTGFADIFNIQ